MRWGALLRIGTERKESEWVFVFPPICAAHCDHSSSPISLLTFQLGDWELLLTICNPNSDFYHSFYHYFLRLRINCRYSRDGYCKDTDGKSRRAISVGYKEVCLYENQIYLTHVPNHSPQELASRWSDNKSRSHGVPHALLVERHCATVVIWDIYQGCMWRSCGGRNSRHRKSRL